MVELAALETLAQRLLAYAETNWAATPSSRDEIAWDGLLDACCSTLRDAGSLERLTWLLFRFLFASDPELEADQETRDLDSLRCNSTRGKAAEAATRLCCYCLRDGIQLPRPLPILLQHFAGDPSLAVRVAVLEPLGFLLAKQPELGWGLLERTLRDQPGPLARYVEPILHRQCQVNFAAVSVLLKRIRVDGLEQGGSTYGRILTLAHLAGHVTHGVLMSELETTNEHVRKGAAQVFCANIANPSDRESCDAGLRIVVEDPACPKAVIEVVERSLRDEQSAGCFDFPFADSFVTAVERQSCPQALGGLVEWLEPRVHDDPEAALRIYERVVQLYAATTPGSFHLLHADPIVSSLLELLKEADQTDDENLIRRVSQLQDKFIELEMPEFDELLHASANL